MERFSLSSGEKLPTTIWENDKEYKINSDYRAVLRVFRMIGDPEIAEADKPWLLRILFYPDKVPEKAEESFGRFVRMGREPEPGTGEKDFDYEQDAPEIWAAFMQTYGIDLTAVEYLHFWQFQMLLNGLFCGANALSAKVHMRHIDDSEGQKKAALARQKQAVQLEQTVSRTEAALADQLQERLKRGQPIGDLLGR